MQYLVASREKRIYIVGLVTRKELNPVGIYSTNIYFEEKLSVLKYRVSRRATSAFEKLNQLFGDRGFQKYSAQSDLLKYRYQDGKYSQFLIPNPLLPAGSRVFAKTDFSILDDSLQPGDHQTKSVRGRGVCNTFPKSQRHTP